jgi:hypothetical protein
MFDIFNILNKVKDVQAKITEVKTKMASITIDKVSSNNLIKVRLNGKKHLVDLHIDDSLLNIMNKDVLIESMCEAINKAMEEVDAMYETELKKNIEGILPHIPGLDLTNLFSGH